MSDAELLAEMKGFGWPDSAEVEFVKDLTGAKILKAALRDVEAGKAFWWLSLAELQGYGDEALTGVLVLILRLAVAGAAAVRERVASRERMPDTVLDNPILKLAPYGLADVLRAEIRFLRGDA